MLLSGNAGRKRPRKLRKQFRLGNASYRARGDASKPRQGRVTLPLRKGERNVARSPTTHPARGVAGNPAA